MTPKEAEELVRARWKSVQRTMGPNPWALRISCARYFDGTQDECWLAAAEFTMQREEEIRQKREEIIKVQRQVDDHHFFCQRNLYGAERDGAIWERILAVLQSQLAALLAGMKETP